jgi:hypothetical protein
MYKSRGADLIRLATGGAGAKGLAGLHPFPLYAKSLPKALVSIWESATKEERSFPLLA